MQILQNFVNNQFEPSASGNTLDVFEPATGQVYARVADSSSKDIEKAVEAARLAFDDWSALSGDERGRFLNRLADAMEDRLEELAMAESKDNGKPVSLATTVDIPRAVANFRFFAAAASQYSSESHAMGNHAINYTLRQPLGVVGCISPWNLPLYLLTWKIAPALAAGNTVVAKPSEVTPMSAAILGEICQQAGLPAGVLNIVHGTPAGERLKPLILSSIFK